MRSPLRVAATASFVLLAFIATACGSGTTDAAPAGDDNEAEHRAPDAPDTATGGDVRLVEVLDVDTGEPTSIADTANGDRPVLLWFWAPH